MKEISERLRPGIPIQPLMDSCVRAVNLGPRPTQRDAPVGHWERVRSGHQRFGTNTANACERGPERLRAVHSCKKELRF